MAINCAPPPVRILHPREHVCLTWTKNRPRSAVLPGSERRSRRTTASGLLFYHDPIQLVRAEGVWMFDADGKHYLDCYNNVPSVGHCNPRVVAAMAEQAATLNTHTRYLDATIIDYAEQLTDTMPPGLDRCVFVNSGTEANELAMRMARTITSNMGTVVVENSYHGNSNLIAELSMMGVPADSRAPHVVAVEPPDQYRGPHAAAETGELARLHAGLVADGIDELDRRSQGIAAFLCDGIFDSQGGLDAPPGYFSEIYEFVRQAGGVCIADEVQPGFGRTGEMWGFTHDDVLPDIVTFGKPAGNGYPLAGVITTSEIMNGFSRQNIYFNTFGGGPVAAAVGSAVLAEINDRDLPAQVTEIGNLLRDQLCSLADLHRTIGNVRGRGLYQGIELVTDRDTRAPNADLARLVPDAMREAGVLMGIAGRHGNVLKVRPPLVFDEANVDQLVSTLDQVLTRLT